MIVHIDKFRQKLDAGQFCLGASVSMSDPAVTEALADSVDFVWIDLEHTPISLESLQAHLMAGRAGGVPVVVRPPSFDVAWIKRVLDTGAEGIVAPQIRSADDARQVVAACRYPPLGQRGYGPRRPSNYGRNGGAEYIADANRRLFVSVQIETAEAYRDLDAILAVEGLDSIVLGPQDLSGSLGLLGQLSHPRVVEAMTVVVQKARAAGLYVGMGIGPDGDFALKAANMGVQWAQCGGDFSYIVQFVDRLWKEIRQRLQAAK